MIIVVAKPFRFRFLMTPVARNPHPTVLMMNLGVQRQFTVRSSVCVCLGVCPCLKFGLLFSSAMALPYEQHHVRFEVCTG